MTGNSKASDSLRARLVRAHAEHRQRHTPTGLRFALADSVEFLEREHWDRVTAQASLFFSRRYLRALESAPPDNVAPRYALVFSGDEPVAAVVGQSVEINGAHVVDALLATNRTERANSTTLDVVRAAGIKLHAAAVRRWKARALVCGNTLSWGQHGVAFAPGIDARTVWPAVAEALYRIRRAERLSGETDLVVIKDLASEHMEAARALEPLSFRSLETEPDMQLELPEQWRSFEDYLASLNTKYRKAARQTIKEIDAAGVRLERVLDLAPHAERLHALYLQVQQRAAVRPVTIARDYLPALARELGADFRCTLARRDDVVLGFVTTLRDGDTAIGYYLGYDSDAKGELPLYFRLLQVVVADALELGCRRLSLGRTALDPKARLGAKPHPQHVWLRHRVPAANLVLRHLSARVRHDEAPERSPFKTES